MEKWLERAQNSLPISPRPFSTLAEELGMEEWEIIDALRRLKLKGVVRRIGAVVEPRTVGAEPVLVALKVDYDKTEQVGREVAQRKEVTHCYERECLNESETCPYNLWIVIAAEKGKREEIIEELKKLEGVREVLVLESEEVYKLKAVFGR